jgi:two-component system sensor histidine kinase/response regulator
MHLLLVEPDRLLAASIAQACERQAHTVTHVVSAQDAVHAADEHAPDVVVLELQMPRHNGVEFLYEFRSYPEWMHIPIVLHTRVPPSELTMAATLEHELGVAQVLYKPTTSLKQLCQALRDLHEVPAT